MQGVVDVVEAEGYGLLLTCNRGEESMRSLGLQVSAKSFDGLLVIEPEGTLDYIAELHEPACRWCSSTTAASSRDSPRWPPPTARAVSRRRATCWISAAATSGDHRSRAFGCTQDRLDGFADVYAAAGIELDPRSIVCGDFTFDCGRRRSQQALADGVEFDAVFAHNDLPRPAPCRPCARPAFGPAGRRRRGLRRHPAGVAHRAPTDHRPPADAGDGRGGGPSAARPCAEIAGGRPSRIIPTTLVIRGSTLEPKPNPN